MKPELAPSILSADFTRLGEQLTALAHAGMQWVHVDVMDGHFVPNLTIGPMVCEAVKRAVPDRIADVHLMVARPGDFVDAFAAAGADWLTVHVESDHHLDRLIQRIRERGMKAGVSLNPATPVSLVEHLLPLVDLVLIMSVNPGFGGQSFIPYCLDKVRALNRLRNERSLSFRISVDGGVNRDNIREIHEAGADVLVAGSAVFRGAPVANFNELNRILTQSR